MNEFLQGTNENASSVFRFLGIIQSKQHIVAIAGHLSEAPRRNIQRPGAIRRPSEAHGGQDHRRLATAASARKVEYAGFRQMRRLFVGAFGMELEIAGQRTGKRDPEAEREVGRAPRQFQNLLRSLSRPPNIGEY
jgi:hypothetical protein